MLVAVAAFVAVWAAGVLGLDAFGPQGNGIPAAGKEPGQYEIIAMHILMAAYFAHLLARTVYLTARYRKGLLYGMNNFV
ncbi:MAG: hypothetical protein K2G18_01270 [Bacteroidales bacterium]|nr:hypothetical protein [Bacteroidales bacterium]